MNDQNTFATQARHVVPRVSAGSSRFSRIHRGLLASLGVTFLLVSAPALAVAVAPTLGVAQQFGALGNSGVTGSAGAGTQVTGDVGSNPAAFAVSNFPPSTVVAPFVTHFAADAVTAQAHLDLVAAYNLLTPQACDATYPSGTDLGGMNLVPGVYCTAGSFAITGVLTLNGTASDVWIFKTGTTVTTAGASSVVMAGGASACNVYWQVGSSATLGGATFSGNVLADASITLAAGNVTGRLLAGHGAAGAVTMPGAGGNTIGGCSLNAPLVIGAVAPTISKRFLPTTIAAGGTSTLTITLSNTSVDTADTITSLTDSLPSGMVIAATPAASTTCGGAVTAVAGTSTVSLGAGGTIPVATLATNTAGTCTVNVNVTSSTAGSLTNTLPAGALVTDNGSNAAEVTATLTVTSLAAATAVPTLSEWAMIMLVALLSITGFVTMRRQSR